MIEVNNKDTRIMSISIVQMRFLNPVEHPLIFLQKSSIGDV